MTPDDLRHLLPRGYRMDGGGNRDVGARFRVRDAHGAYVRQADGRVLMLDLRKLNRRGLRTLLIGAGLPIDR